MYNYFLKWVIQNPFDHKSELLFRSARPFCVSLLLLLYSFVLLMVCVHSTKFLSGLSVFYAWLLLQSSGPTDDAVLKTVLPCSASVDSFLEYGQNAILSTGNFLCSAKTANSTMDFSSMPVDEGVVDSPPSRVPSLPKSCSPSPLRTRDPFTSRMSPSASERLPMRKLYDDVTHLVPAMLPNSHVHKESSQDRVRVRSHGPLLRVPYDQSTVRRTKTHDGVPHSRSTHPIRDVWDRKFIQVQKLQTLREYKKMDNGYSRGPEILKAMELLNSQSDM